ncbi:MAG: hypothetical protein KJO69_07155 [Gammaproteobacteria bacterium]|nr:hypothetical protein [Gammaproteobacteria bacterium]
MKKIKKFRDWIKKKFKKKLPKKVYTLHRLEYGYWSLSKKDEDGETQWLDFSSPLSSWYYNPEDWGVVDKTPSFDHALEKLNRELKRRLDVDPFDQDFEVEIDEREVI